GTTGENLNGDQVLSSDHLKRATEQCGCHTSCDRFGIHSSDAKNQIDLILVRVFNDKDSGERIAEISMTQLRNVTSGLKPVMKFRTCRSGSLQPESGIGVGGKAGQSMNRNCKGS